MGFGGFSWKRVLGLTKAKSRLSRSIGVPLTKGGRQRKIGAALGCGILGAAVGSTGRRLRSAAVRPGGHDDHDDADTPVIFPHGKELYGLPQSGAGFTCLMLAVMLLLPIAFFPTGILISIALLIVLLMHAHKKNGVSRENISFFFLIIAFSAFAGFSAGADEPAPYRGNRESGVFHDASCRYFHCDGCTVTFQTRADALAANYRPCKTCNP